MWSREDTQEIIIMDRYAPQIKKIVCLKLFGKNCLSKTIQKEYPSHKLCLPSVKYMGTVKDLLKVCTHTHTQTCAHTHAHTNI